ncbi:MAG TPA: GNA1162 family protein [Nitrospirota bacterium]
MRSTDIHLMRAVLITVLIAAAACGSAGTYYKDQKMDFGSVMTVAVMPLSNLSRDPMAADRVRDAFMTQLLATYGVYVVPPGEVARAIGVTGIGNPTAPSKEEIIKVGSQLKVDGVITGVVREYGEVRSGSAGANVISLSMQMTEVQAGKVVWSASTTEGGIGFLERLFGGGGEPLDDVTEKAVKNVINKFYK